jgi:hypothetical protein
VGQMPHQSMVLKNALSFAVQVTAGAPYFKRSGNIYGPVNRLRQAIFTALSFLVSTRPVFIVKVKLKQK